MLGQKLLSQHLYTVTTNNFFLMRTCSSIFSKLQAKKNLLLKHTICSVVYLGQNKMNTD